MMQHEAATTSIEVVDSTLDELIAAADDDIEI